MDWCNYFPDKFVSSLPRYEKNFFLLVSIFFCLNAPCSINVHGRYAAMVKVITSPADTGKPARLEVATLNPDSLVKDLVDHSANTLIINAVGFMAFYPSKLPSLHQPIYAKEYAG